MTQNSRPFALGLVAFTTLVALAAGPVVAQDDQPDPAPAEEAAASPAPAPTPAPTPAPLAAPVDRLRFRVEVADWVALPAGLEFEPVSVVDPFDPYGTTIDDMEFDTESSARYGLGVDFPNGRGSIQGYYWATNSSAEETEATPGEFGFGELLAFPELAGFANDGLADGYSALAETESRELRIDYVSPAFGSGRVRARWFVGYRQLSHDRVISAEYDAFEPLLPPLFPPFVDEARPDLDPLADTAVVSSEFDGRGVEGGLRIALPVLSRDRLVFEGGFALAALRGDTDSAYRASNAFYVHTDELGNRTVLDAPYDQFDDLVGDPPAPYVNDVTQETLAVGIRTQSRSTSASVIEAELGLRWRFWNQFELFGGYRSAIYDNVGVDLKLAAPTDQNRQTVTEQSRSVYYEGFYFGLAFGF